MSFWEPPPPSPEPPEEPEFPPRPPWAQPQNELGSPVPLRLVLGRTERVAVALVGALAYSNGVAFVISVRQRHRAAEAGLESPYNPFEHPFGWPGRGGRRGRELPPAILRFGVQFSDGRKAMTTGDPFGLTYTSEVKGGDPTGPLLVSGGGGGSEGGWDSQFWLWPVPPPGPLTFAIEWPSEQIELTKHEVDAALLIEASKSSEELWPESSSHEPSGSRSREIVFGTDSIHAANDPDKEEAPDESDS